MKYNIKHPVSTTLGAAPASLVIDMSGCNEAGISLLYGTGSSSSAKLQSSNDGTNYADYPNSSATLDNAGGVQLWNISDYRELYLKVVVSGDAATNSVIVVSNNLS